MATVYFTASSLDGYIVDDSGSLDWLTSRAVDADGPFGYQEFIESVGALVMGSATYEWVVNNHPGDWMYEQPSWVLTHRRKIIAEGHPVQTSDGDVAELHPKLVSAAAGKDVWVVGGGDVAGPVATPGRPIPPGRPDRRDDRHLCALLARRRFTAAAGSVRVGARRVQRQR